MKSYLKELVFRYGRIDRVKLLEKDCDELHCAVVAFVDIRSAQKAHSTSNILGENHLKTSYSEAAGKIQIFRGFTRLHFLQCSYSNDVIKIKLKTALFISTRSTHSF